MNRKGAERTFIPWTYLNGWDSSAASAATVTISAFFNVQMRSMRAGNFPDKSFQQPYQHVLFYFALELSISRQCPECVVFDCLNGQPLLYRAHDSLNRV